MPLADAPGPLEEAADRAVARARERGAPVLLSWTEAADGVDPLRFLASGEAPRVFLAGPGGQAAAGLGEAARLEAAGQGRFDAVRLAAEALLRGAEVLGPPGAPGPRFLGGFAFADDHAPEGPWTGFPAASFALPRAAVVRDGPRGWVAVHRLVEGREDPGALARHVARAAAAARAPAAPLVPAAPGVPLPAFGARVLDRGAWTVAVDEALGAIRRGALAKVVLARRVPVPLTAPLAGPEAMARLEARYPDCHRYLLEPRGGRGFLGASPERLAALRAGAVASDAVAGSAPRGADAAADARLGQGLLDSGKERREHDLVVQHLRAGLADLGGKVAAPAAPGLLRLRNVQHLHTPLAAEVPPGTHVLDVVAALHPSPAVGGAPRREALEFLARREGFPRGWYAGAVGWFDARGEGDFAVALRCALLAGEEAWLYAGAGIVAGADPAREYEETALKLEPMLEALGCKA